MQPLTSLALSALTLTGSVFAQSAVRIDPAKGGLGFLTHPYQARYVPPVDLSNSPRLESLIRAGNLYLSASDVIALAVENNPDIEVQRYNPLLAREVLKRAQGGGALRSVGQGVAAGPQSVSLAGVSINATGVSVAGGGGVSSGGGIVTQLGPAIPGLDPNIIVSSSLNHVTNPQSNTFLTGIPELIQTSKSVQAAISETWTFGLTAQLTYASTNVSVNSRNFGVNPYTTGDLDLLVTQNLLQGFGAAVNGRNIRVQKNNLKVADLQFKQQVITTVAAVLNLYWDLVTFRQDFQSRQRELQAAQQLLADDRKQVLGGLLAQIEVTRAEAGVATAEQDLLISETNLLQQETVLKNALSRNGISAANLMELHVIPLDSIPTPAQDDNAPLDQLVNTALANRVEVQQSQINIDSNKMNLIGIKNSLRPTLQAFAELTNNALAGQLTALGALVPANYAFAGGYGSLWEEILRRNYPNYSAGFSLNIPIRNRAAQADYVTSELELRQNELTLQKTQSLIKVEVQNAAIGVRQARARYEAGVRARTLQQQTLDADQQKYGVGLSTSYQVMLDQRDLANAATTELEALANYSHARIALDQALGRTLETNHVSIAEATSGRVSRPSLLPANLPQGAQP